MKSFMEEYGMAIIASVVILILIVMCTPIGKSVAREFFTTMQVFKEDKSNKCNVYFYSGEGRFVTGESMLAVEMEKLSEVDLSTIPTPTLKNFIFEGWYTSPNEGEKLEDRDVIKGEMKYYAHFKTNGNIQSDFGSTGMLNGILYINNVEVGEFKKGTTFEWKGYTWKVLDLSGNEALIISEKVLDRDFNTDSYARGTKFNSNTSTESMGGKTVTNYYYSSFLKSRMNDFYSQKLNRDVAIKSVPITIGLYNNEGEYSVGSIKTDYVFALSYTETRKYMENNKSKIAYNGDLPMMYWTRSGQDTDGAFAVYSDGTLVNANTTDECGIRPAMYLDLTKISGITIIN